ncbi:MazG nucleotide pyrophosphohydrolase domain-containing protein [Alkaliphilus oremlandii]|uniref:MazG nucleotide pyrophosphohydrolase n=1 Tax=Alkaliphilus oremlandii (strain OhILAs) TaxID=350688 RepID=A8MK37_ALKOO|nr:MazG nucleotide pyrophosphohydrolase domain-containing protein [Alkaliphilus oremlandii]ABW20169.1 MazG nucleotide pyrophosphohydrolase [Alkaliphilus oremlandii OhILAs]
MGKLTIVGLGPGGKEHLTLAIYEAMKNHTNIYLRTEQHPVVPYLKEMGILFHTFDGAYDRYETFEEVYQHIADTVLQEAKSKDVLYAVPGHPFVAENTVQLIIEGCKEHHIEREVYPAMSFVDAMFMALEVDPVDGFQLIDGLNLDVMKPDPNMNTVITQVYDSFIASDIKLKLMNYYDDEQEIYVVRAAGVPGLQKIAKIKLYELDRLGWVDYLTTVFIKRIENSEKKYYNMNNLVQIMERLRSTEGCPWDRKQTHESLKKYLIEESGEVLEAIDACDDSSIEEELGDVLLQVVFHSQIAKERGAFQIEDVIRGICKKLIFRHPHIFGDQNAYTEEDVAKIWEEQKKKEKEMKNN